jgi:uncharacterized delta-60 repeat protein
MRVRVRVWAQGALVVWGLVFGGLNVSSAWGQSQSVQSTSPLLDMSFNSGGGGIDGGLVEQIVPQPDGKVLICGNFTQYDGVQKSYITRLNPDGTLDSSFSAGVSYWVRTMALQKDGKIVIGGFFNNVEGQSRNLIARLNADGSLDYSFDPGTGASGTLGTAITGNPTPFIFYTALQPDGKILITGNFTNYNGVARNGIARLNTNGTLDVTFNVGGGLNNGSWGRSLLVQSNNQIIITGWFTSYNGHGFNRMVRVNPDGSADTTFNPYFGDLTAVYTCVQLTNGQYIVAGHCENTSNYFTNEVARLNSDGSYDTTFVGSANDKVETIRLQADGKIVMSGYFSLADGVDVSGIARLNADGTLDRSFFANFDNYIWYTCCLPDGKILFGGGFYTVDGISRSGIARLNPGPTMLSPQRNANTYSISIATVPYANYTLQYKSGVSQPTWIDASSIVGDGTVQTLSDSNATNNARIYRLQTH